MFPNLKFPLRQLTKSPGFTLVAILMLAVGIGASTACFSFLNAFFLQPPPFAHPDELVSLHGTDAHTPGLMRLSYPNFLDYRAHNTVFTDLALHMYAGAVYRDHDQNIDLYGQIVSGGFFPVLGVRAALGRALNATDDPEGAPPVVVVSDSFWRNRLGADPTAVGRTIILNHSPFTVVGIAPAEFRGVTLLDSPEFWVPTSAVRTLLGPQGVEYFNSRRAVTVNAVGRLKPGVTLAQADAALQPITQHLAEAFPADNAGRAHRLIPVAQAMVDPNVRADAVRAGNLLMALSALILVIACANLANLLLARGTGRQREMALRVALGANRRRVAAQLLQENLLLAVLGGGLGIVLASWMRDLLWALRPDRGFGDNLAIPMDGRVLAFALAATALTGLLFGLLPALSGSRVDLVAVLKRAAKDGGVPLLSFRNALVAAQVALSVVALVVAGLFLRSLQRASMVNLGWNSRGIALFSAAIGREGYDQPRSLAYYQRALDRLRSIPGVVDASVSTRAFLTGVNPQRTIRPQGNDEAMRTHGQFMSYASVLPGFVRFMGIDLAAGRDFAPTDDESHPAVALVNETFARRAWPGENPLGKTLKLYQSEVPVEVVGIVRDTRDVELKAAPAPFAYFPLRQQFAANNVFHVRLAGNPTAMMPTLRRELQALDPAVSLFGFVTYDDLIHQALWGARAGAALMTVFGAIALLLTSLGIYAVMAHAVSQRTREIGIRLAIGAQAHAVVTLILRRGVAVAATGLFAGLIAALALTRYTRSLLFGITTTDPLTFIAITVLLAVVALIACLLPARRATRIDPIVALRAE